MGESALKTLKHINGLCQKPKQWRKDDLVEHREDF